MGTSASRDAPDRDGGKGGRVTGAPRDLAARPDAAYKREPLPLARSILWYPAGRGSRDTGARGGYAVFVEQATLNAIRSHVEAAPGDPLLGFLAGELMMDPDIEVPYIVVDGVFVCRYPIEHEDPMPAFRRVWDRLQNEVQRVRTQLVGWYRSSPRGDVHMGPLDVAVHEAHFPEPWQVAIVVRPDRSRPAGGIYRMVPGTTWPASPISFYELLETQPRRTAGGKRTRLTWKNYHSSELVLAADERGVRPEDDEPEAPAAKTEPAEERRERPTVPTLRPPAAAAADGGDERRRPTLKVVRTDAMRSRAPAHPRPQPLEPPRPRRDTVPRATVPTRVSQAVLAPADAPPLRTVAGRRWHRRLVTLAAVCGLVAAAGLGALVMLERTTLDEGTPVDVRHVRLARLDIVTDTLAPALRNFGERAGLYRDGLLGCDGLARGYAAVDTLWAMYGSVRRGVVAPLDSGRQVRDTRLSAQVDAMRREFVRSGCRAP